MLKVIKHYSRYLWGSDGHLHAVTVFDTRTKTVRTFTQWGGYIKRGNYRPSQYGATQHETFADAKNSVDRRCEGALPNRW